MQDLAPRDNGGRNSFLNDVLDHAPYLGFKYDIRLYVMALEGLIEDETTSVRPRGKNERNILQVSNADGGTRRRSGTCLNQKQRLVREREMIELFADLRDGQDADVELLLQQQLVDVPSPALHYLEVNLREIGAHRT